MTVLWKLFFIIIFFTLDIWSQTNPNQGIEAQNHKKNKSISSKEKKLQQNLGKWTGLDLEKNKEIPIFLVAGSVEYKDLEDGSKVWIATKGVHAWQGEVLTPIMELFCEQAVVWILNEEQKKENKQQKNIMFYAEEKVHFRWEDNFFRGEQIYFDLVNNHGLIGNGSFRVQQNIGEKKYPLYVRAEKIRILSKEKIIGENASFSTCRFGVPHYHFETGKVIVRKFNEEIFLQSRDNTIWGLDFPLFTIPYITGETIENFPLKKISYGKKSNWGQHLLTRWGGNLYKDDNIIKRAKWFLDLDTRAKRGIGVGPGITYSGSLLSSDEFKGRIYGYYSHDQPLGHLGKSMDREQKKGEYATWSKRHRMYILHRHKFANNWSLDAELSLLNDRNFLLDFFEQEYREEKEPETYAYVKKQGILFDELDAFTFLTRGRLNNFQSQIEYLPQATYQIIFLPIFSEQIPNLFFSSTLESSYVRRKDDKDDPTIWDDKDLFRLDFNNYLYYKYSISSIHFMPYLGGRISYFEDGQNNEKNLTRATGELGIEISTNFHRYYQWHSNLLQIDNILHIFTPQFKYKWIYANSVESKKLIPMDTMEDVDEMQLIQLIFNNRLRTMRENKIRDFFKFDVIFTYYPERDLAKQNIKKTKYGWPVSNRWEKYDNLKMDMRWDIRNNVWIQTKPEYNFQLREIEKINSSIGYRLTDKFSITLDHRYQRSDVDLITTYLSYIFNEKWSFHLAFQYELRDLDLREFDITIRRIFHRFALDIIVKIDEVGDDTSATVNFYPLDLLQSNNHYHHLATSE